MRLDNPAEDRLPTGVSEEFPDTLDIFSTEWRITYKDSTYEIGTASDTGKSQYGDCSMESRTIEVYRGKREAADLWKVLIHEIIHVIVDELGMPELERLPDDVQEKIIDTLSVGLVDTIIRNRLKIIE